MAKLTEIDLRRSPRVIPSEKQELMVRYGGETLGAVICDVSEGGIRFSVPVGLDISANQIIAIGQEQVVNLRARVRWVRPSEDTPNHTLLGLQFDSIIVQPKKGDEVQEVVNAWMQIANSYSTFDNFLRVLDLVDNDILDGRLVHFADAIARVALWLEGRLGELNLWHVGTRADGVLEVNMLVDLAYGAKESFDTRRKRVNLVSKAKVTRWFDRRPYIYAENLVIEFFGSSHGKIDLLHKIGVVLGKRVRTWNKLIGKNIALDALSDELDWRNR